MAKKKKTSHKSSPTEFSNSPFKSLKGLSALEPETPQEKSAPDTLNKTTRSQVHGPEETSFADEMNFLGVQPMDDQSDDENISRALKQQTIKTSKAISDQDEFLEAVGSIDKVFKDEWPEDESVRAVPRRMKQVERGQLKPQDELDLHGFTVEEARVKVKFFLQNSIYNGLNTVIIITGKGLHSEEGPVLRKAIERLLGDLGGLVVEWGYAPRRYGGDGALVIFLRQSE